MQRRFTLPIAPTLAVPSLALIIAACSGDIATNPRELTEADLAAVTSTAGAPRDQLAEQVADLYYLPALGETRALLVVADGKIAAERYGEGYDADTRFVSWSMAKTVTAMMIGMLVADGRLQLDEPAPVDQWQRPGDPRAAITLRHLLQMRSGLDHTEEGDPPYEGQRQDMLFGEGRDDMAQLAEEQPLEAEPGEKFEYSTNTTVILADIAARALTQSDNPDDRVNAVTSYLEERLFVPLGITSAILEFDNAGTFIGSSFMYATARDWAKLGEMMRRKGRAPSGEQLVPSRWIDQMVTPSPASPHYGFQTWLNRPMGKLFAGESDSLFPDRAPHSVFAMIGHMGQYVIVSPEQRVTIVRLGHSDGPQREAMLQEVADVLDLYPVR